MQHLPPSSSRHRLAILAAAFGLALMAAPAAHAFTIDDQSNTNANGSARYADPDERFAGTGTTNGNGQTVLQQGNATLRFGGQQGSFDQRFNSNRIFDSIGRPGDDR